MGPIWPERLGRARDRYHLKPALVLILYLAVPLATFRFILFQYPELDPSRFNNASMYIVPASAILFILAILQEGHPKGTRRRLGLDAAYVLLSLVWMIAIIGGNAVIHSEYDGHPFYIDVTPLVLIGVAAAALNLGHDYLEHLHFGAVSAAAATPAMTGFGTYRELPTNAPAESAGRASADLSYLVPACGRLCEPPPVDVVAVPETALFLQVDGAPAEAGLARPVARDVDGPGVAFSLERDEREIGGNGALGFGNSDIGPEK